MLYSHAYGEWRKSWNSTTRATYPVGNEELDDVDGQFGFRMESIEQINISREQQGNIVKWNCNSTETENSIIIVYNLFFFLQYFIFFL